eukprot:COSAG02_NODE_31130_length_538_cov_8.018223_1_plen_57_part_01
MQPPGTKVGQVGTKLLQTWYQKVYALVPKLPNDRSATIDSGARVGGQSCQTTGVLPS